MPFIFIALSNAKKRIAILGSGIDCIYPLENKELFESIEKNGLIISEYPGYTIPTASRMSFKNRIISALGNTLYVMQVNNKSPNTDTISTSMELGKDIKVLPFRANDTEGTFNNELINEGAMIIGKGE